MKKSFVVLAAAAAATLSGNANAVLLDGATINYQYYYPDSGSPYGFADNGNKVVGAGIEVSNIADSTGTIDISDTNIFVDFTTSTSWNGAAFNGWVITDVFNTIGAFTSVTINGATNMAGFSAANVSWQGLSFDANTVVSLDINGAGGAVPEPTTWAMMVAGIAMVGGALRTRKSKAVVAA
jgi:hypothetical protein